MRFRISLVLNMLLLIGSKALFASNAGISIENTHVTKQIDSLIKLGKSNLGNPDVTASVILNLTEAKALSEEYGYDDGYVRSSYNLGKVNLYKSNTAEAASQFFTTLKKAEQINDSFHISKSILQLGLVMYNLNKWEEALKYFDQSIEIRKSKDEDHSYHLEEYLAGICYFRLKNYNKSEELLNQALQHAELHQDTIKHTEISIYLNHIDLETNYNDSIIPRYNGYFEFFMHRKDKVGMCYSLLGKSKAYLKEDNNVEAVNFANLSLVIAREIQLLSVIKDIIEVMVEAQYAKGNYKAASDYMIDLEAIKDSIQSQNTQSDISMLRAGYSFDKKEAEYTASIEKQNAQRRTLILIAVGLIIIVISIVYFLRIVFKERKRSDNLLLNILPAETAKELKDFGSSIAKSHEEVTIVFADIVSFTKIAKNLKAHDLVQMLDSYFRAFDEVIDKLGLEKIKTIGDAYMFVSGLSHDKNSAIPAVDAATEMIKNVESLEKEIEEKFGTSFKFRFGMHTGEVVSGVVGSKKYAFDIWGDAVNIAARMEENSTSGKINLTKSTYKLIHSKYKCTYRGNIDIKNHNSIDMYYVDDLN